MSNTIQINIFFLKKAFTLTVKFRVTCYYLPEFSLKNKIIVFIVQHIWITVS